MPDTPDTRFLVDPDSDPVAIRIEGRASFQNCSCVKDFLARMFGGGKRRFVMDFDACTGMDSTFLGVLAGMALQLRKAEPSGSLVLARLNERNRELVSNLGLDRILIVDDDAAQALAGASNDQLNCAPVTDEVAAARIVLEAHQNLIAADAENEAKFRDVMAYLEQQLGDKSG